MPAQVPVATPTQGQPSLVRAAAPIATVRPSATPATVPTPTLEPSPTPEVTPDPTRAAQQAFCDQAAPPAHLPLPLDRPIRIPPPSAATVLPPSNGGPQRQNDEPAPQVTAKHVAVIDEASGALLYQVDPFTRVAPASITKIATADVALERHPDVSTEITTTISATAMVACDGSSVMGLEPDDHVALLTLLYGMLLPSGNDAAEQIAYSLAGSRERFVDWMNQKVQSLGLKDTHFVTPSGMDADGHYTSAYDIAMLARDAMRNPTFRQIVATPRYVGDEYYMHNLNGLLGTYQGADGVKIGYTDDAGRTIVASATRDGHRVYVSLMHSDNLVGDCAKLLDWVWRTYRW